MIETLGDLTPDPRNARKHNSRNVGMLEKALNEVGAARSIVIDEHGVILAGNATIEAAARAGIEKVQVVDADGETIIAVRRTGLTEAQKTRLALYDNRTAELADWDAQLITELLANERAILDGLFYDSELADITDSIATASEPVETIDQGELLNQKWQVKTGDLWLIGNHRLLCGDSTAAADVARLLAGIVPVLMVTDPPYGVNYDASWRVAAGLQKTGAHLKVANDNRADWGEAWALFTGDIAYVWHAGTQAHVVAQSLEAHDLMVRGQIIWAKNHLVIGRGDYQPQHEPCWYCVRSGQPGLRTGDRKQSTLWQIDKPRKSETGHSTQKPIECMARPMRNHEADTVYDPFAGSGTTLVAGEQLGRTVYAMELTANYCAIILERMSTEFAGLTIKKDDVNIA